MSGMALYLSWVPCVAAFVFIGLFIESCWKSEAAKTIRDAMPDTATDAHEFLVSIAIEEREVALV